MELCAEGRREHIPVLIIHFIREVTQRIVRVREAQHLLTGQSRRRTGATIQTRHETGLRGPYGRWIRASRDLVAEAIKITLAAQEALLLLRVAAAEGQCPIVRDFKVQVRIGRIGLGLDVVSVVIDPQVSRVERHEVVHVARFREVVQAHRVVQPIVDRRAGKLELLGELALLLFVSHLLLRLRSTIQIGAYIPQDLPLAGDRLELHLIAQRPIERDRSAISVETSKARAIRVRGVDVAGLGVCEIPIQSWHLARIDHGAHAIRTRAQVHIGSYRRIGAHQSRQHRVGYAHRAGAGQRRNTAREAVATEGIGGRVPGAYTQRAAQAVDVVERTGRKSERRFRRGDAGVVKISHQ